MHEISLLMLKFKEKDKEIVNIGEGCYLSTEVGGAVTRVYIGLYATGNGENSTSTAYFD